MSFYPCRVGYGKSPLNKEFQVIGCSFVGEPNKSQTISTDITNADFIVITSFYKRTSVSGTFTINGTNKAVGIIGKVGESVIIDGEFDFTNKNYKAGTKARLTWNSSNIVKLENVEGAPVLSAALALFYCQYV